MSAKARPVATLLSSKAVDHLVARDGRPSRHARADVREVAPETRDDAADGQDRLPSLRVVSLFLHEHEQPVTVGREEVAGVGIVESADRERRGPGDVYVDAPSRRAEI